MKTMAAVKPDRTDNSGEVNRVLGFTEWGLLIILSVLWGGSFFFVGVAVREATPLTIVWVRVSPRGRPPPQKKKSRPRGRKG